MERAMLDEVISTSPRNYLVIGNRASGKTTLVADLIQKITDKNVGTSVIVYADSHNVPVFEKLVPMNHIYTEFNTHFLEAFNAHKKNPTNPLVFIFDDVFTSSSDLKALNEIIMAGKKSNVYTIITMQFAMGMKPTVLEHIDHVFAFRDRLRGNIERLYEYYFGFTNDFEKFKETILNLPDFKSVFTPDKANKKLVTYQV